MEHVPQRAYHEVARTLIEQLRAENAHPGTRLPAERELAERLDVSRLTVREALVALELRGVVETHVGSGTFVADLNAPATDLGDGRTGVIVDASPSDILRARMAIAPGLARLAAITRDRGALAAIARPVHQVEKMALVGSTEHPGREDRRFHAAVAEATGNPVLARLAGPYGR